MSTTSGPLADGWVDAVGVEAAGRAEVVIGVATGCDGEPVTTDDRDVVDVTGAALALDDRRGGVDEQATIALTASAAASMASRLGRCTPQRGTPRWPNRVGAAVTLAAPGQPASSAGQWRSDDKEHPLSGRGGGGGFGGQQPNMQQLMKQAQKMQQQLEAAQAELAAAEVVGTAGGGLVTATVTGSGELTGLTIDPSAVDPDDVETLQDLVVAAVRDANRAAAELAAEKMGPVTGDGGLGGLGLPGF